MIPRCDAPGCEWSAMYQLRPTVEVPCETCGGTGFVECWSPGGPCPGAGPCESCGPCLQCRVLLLCEEHARPFMDLPTLWGVA